MNARAWGTGKKSGVWSRVEDVTREDDEQIMKDEDSAEVISEKPGRRHDINFSFAYLIYVLYIYASIIKFECHEYHNITEVIIGFAIPKQFCV